MFIHFISFSSGWVAEWPAAHSLGQFFSLYYDCLWLWLFPVLVLGAGFGVGCFSFCFLHTFTYVSSQACMCTAMKTGTILPCFKSLWVPTTVLFKISHLYSYEK